MSNVIDVGNQRAGPYAAASTATMCVRCFTPAVTGSDWCGPCHPRNPNPPPLGSDDD